MLYFKLEIRCPRRYRAKGLYSRKVKVEIISWSWLRHRKKEAMADKKPGKTELESITFQVSHGPISIVLGTVEGITTCYQSLYFTNTLMESSPSCTLTLKERTEDLSKNIVECLFSLNKLILEAKTLNLILWPLLIFHMPSKLFFFNWHVDLNFRNTIPIYQTAGSEGESETGKYNARAPCFE